MISVSEDYKKAMQSDIITPIIKFELLDKDFNIIDEITTDVSYDDIGSISIDKTRDIRSQFSITFDNHNGKFTWGEDKLIWIDQKRVKLYIGFKLPTGEIEYAPQGVFILTSPEANSSPTENTVTVSGQDQWYLLTGNFGKFTTTTIFSAYTLDENGDYILDENNESQLRMEYDENGNPIRHFRITNYIISLLKKAGITKMIIDECDAYLTTDLTYEIGDNIGQAIKDLTEQCYSRNDNYFYEAFFDCNGYFRFQKFQNPTEIAPCAVYKIEDLTMYAGSNRTLDDSTLFNHIVVLGGSGESAEFRSEEIVDEDAFETFKFGDSTKSEFALGTMDDVSCDYLGKMTIAQGQVSSTIGDTTRIVGNGTYKTAGTFTSRWFDVKTDHKYKTGKVSWVDSVYDADAQKRRVERFCTVCGCKSSAPVDGHTHLWSSTISSYDEYCHYYDCQYGFCNEKKPEPHKMPATYTYYPELGYKERKCKICDYVERKPYSTDTSHSHSYVLAPHPKFPDVVHAMVCKTSGCEDVQEDGITPGNSDDSITAQDHCYINDIGALFSGNVCGEHKILSYPNEDGTIPGIRLDSCRCGHTRAVAWTTATPEGSYAHADDNHHVAEDAEWVYDENKHWHHCDYFLGCPKHMDEAAHVWDDGVVVKAPTKTEDGSMTVTCTICGYTKTETLKYDSGYELIGSDGHTHTSSLEEYGMDEDKHWFICDICGEPFMATKHTWRVTDTITSEATVQRHETVTVTIQYGDEDKNVVAEEVINNGDELTVLHEGDDIYPYMRYIVHMTTDNTSASPIFTNIQIEMQTMYQPWKGHPYSIQKIGDRMYLWNDGIDSNIDTQSQCNARAKFELEKNLCYTENVSLTVAPIYIHECDDVICIEDENNGCKDNYQIVSYSIPIKPSLMEIEVQRIRGDLA